MKLKINVSSHRLPMIVPLLLIALGGGQGSNVKVEAASLATASSDTSNRLAEAIIPPASALPATLVSTGDGDTLRVQITGEAEPTTIRLGCIDAPEHDQPRGDWSAAQLAARLSRGTAIQLTPFTTDRYDRIVAELWQDGSSLNLELLSIGAAVVYPQYVSQCSAPDAFKAAEATASTEGIGFWSLLASQQISLGTGVSGSHSSCSSIVKY
jgi:endonuclease YncB( thermonuclease family)